MQQTYQQHPVMVSWIARLCVAGFLALSVNVQPTESDSKSSDDLELATAGVASERKRDDPSIKRSPLQAPFRGEGRSSKPEWKEIRAGQPSGIRNRHPLVEELRRHNLYVHETPQGVVVTLPADLFTFTAVQLTNAARVQLRHIAASLSPHRDDYRLSVTGYVPAGTRLQCTKEIDIQGAETTTFGLEAAGLSRYQMQVQPASHPTSILVQGSSTQDLISPAELEKFRVEILITD